MRHSLELSGHLAALGDLTVRTTDVLPRLGINAFDIEQPDALLMIQIYEFKPTGEAAPILTLSRADGAWFDHFARQIERLWADGTTWAGDRGVRALGSTPADTPARPAAQRGHAPAAERSEAP